MQVKIRYRVTRIIHFKLLARELTAFVYSSFGIVVVPYSVVSGGRGFICSKEKEKKSTLYHIYIYIINNIKMSIKLFLNDFLFINEKGMKFSANEGYLHKSTCGLILKYT